MVKGVIVHLQCLFSGQVCYNGHIRSSINVYSQFSLNWEIGQRDNLVMKPISINEKLVWDMDIPVDAPTNEAFRKWYVKRVLTHGTAADIRVIGLEAIRHYLPHLYLPADIRDFWLWYFNEPTAKDCHGHLDVIPETAS